MEPLSMRSASLKGSTIILMPDHILSWLQFMIRSLNESRGAASQGSDSSLYVRITICCRRLQNALISSRHGPFLLKKYSWSIQLVLLCPAFLIVIYGASLDNSTVII